MKVGFFTCAPFYIGLWAVIKNPHDFLPGGYWYLTITFIVCCGGTILFSLKSFWAYGENGIEILNFSGECVKKYSWNDVSRIDYFGFREPWPFIEMKDGRKIYINAIGARNYVSVLSSAVKLVQKKCPETYISPRISKLSEKGPRHFF